MIEDIDVKLDSDKGFYKSLHEICSVSKGPIILTCSKIPYEFSNKQGVEY